MLYNFSLNDYLITEENFNNNFSNNYLEILIVMIIIFPIFSIFIVVLLNHNNTISTNFTKLFCLSNSIFLFLITIALWFFFDETKNQLQGIVHLFSLDLHFLVLDYVVGIDGISLFFISLTALLIPICYLISWDSIFYKQSDFFLCLLIIEVLLINMFLVLDLTLFYIFFESILIPMFLFIGVWGARSRKIHAAIQFFLYTLLSSLLMLIGLIIIYLNYHTTNLIILLDQHEFSQDLQLYLWLLFFIPFAVKVPIIPFHIWLPEAHVEAPTAGSVLLAGILLKLGTYAILRFLIPLFSYANDYYTPFVLTICTFSVIYSSFTTIRQIDLKKIIAYSSVAHMNFAMIGLYTPNEIGITGSLFLMLSHGLVSSALFICIGIIYDRYHTRILAYYGGLAKFMPIFSGFFLIFSLANIGLPGTSSFVGESLIIIGHIEFNIITIFFATLSVILGAVYGLWLFNRVMFGPLKSIYLSKFSDLNLKEIFALAPLCILIIFSGIYPGIFIKALEPSLTLTLTYFFESSYNTAFLFTDKLI